MKKIPLFCTVGCIAVLCATSYLIALQSLRQSANDPQIQMAQDEMTALNDGEPIAMTLGSKVNINTSLAPFVIIYDAQGKVAGGNGYLNAKVPAAPIGLLTAANGKDYSATTWQPQRDIRIAAVSVKANNYYVLSGRSLKTVEERENSIIQIAIFGFVISTGIVLAGYYWTHKMTSNKEE